jgi:hypothetical protein
MKHLTNPHRKQQMQIGLLFNSQNWREWQKWPSMVGRHLRSQSMAMVRLETEKAQRSLSQAYQMIVRRKSYPSQRACPVCDGKTHYIATLATSFTGLYTRSCPHCGYCDSRRVRMVKQL